MGAFDIQSAKANASSGKETGQTADTDWWPMFHHDTSHTGTSTSTAPTTNSTLWNYKTGGGVESSPAVASGLVYVGSDDDNVYCLNATTGSLLWNYTTGGSVESSPAVASGLVYVGSSDRITYCLNATTGAFVWSYKTGFFVGSSPAVVNGVVYVKSNDDNIYAFGPSSTVPEFPSYLILPLFTMTTLLMAFVPKRKRNTRT
jgi:outer membrane protein assembly factor BamB